MDTDEALYRRVKEGDLGAFDELYARYETRLFGFLLGQLTNRADAEEAFHETFLATLSSREVRFERGGGFRVWLYRIARNTASNRRRSSRRGEHALAKLGEGDEPQPHRPDELLAEQQLLHALDGAVSRLPDTLSEVYHLRRSGLSYEEIAGVLEIPLGTLKSRMNQLVTQLRKDLEPWTAR